MKSRKKITRPFFIAATLLLSIPATALAGNAGMEHASQDALAKTLELLTQPTLRDQAIQKDPNAQFIDHQVKSLAGSEALTQEIYELASDIFKTLIEKSNGDSMAALTELQKAKNDPKGFAAKLTSAQQAKLRTIAQKIEAAKTSNRPTLKK